VLLLDSPFFLVTAGDSSPAPKWKKINRNKQKKINRK
jgi:hypothetical protein